MTAANTLASLGTSPAFSYTNSTGTVIPSGTWTKIVYDTKRFDTTTSMYSTANSRFTPTVAGYYQVNGYFNIGTGNLGILAIYKNGVAYQYSGNNPPSALTGISGMSVLLYLNGSTDYIELWGYTNSTVFYNGSQSTTFSASMVRAA